MKSTKRFIFTSIMYVCILIQCSSKNRISDLFNHGIEKIGRKYIFDKSLVVYQVDLKNIGGKWTVSGMTSHALAYQEINSFSDSLFQKNGYINKIVLLPDSELGDSSYAIINVSVTPIREKPSHASQMLDQAIMGYPIRLLKQEDGWFLSQTHYDYVGWINKTAFHRCDSSFFAEWESTAQHRIVGLNPMIFSKPDFKSIPVSDAVLNNQIKVLNRNREWVKISLPDGRLGYILNSEIDTLKIVFHKSTYRKDLLSKAYQMMGVPYLWGGNSSKGNDCSGFTQTVFKAFGEQLPRDARQQALVGKQIQPNESWSNVVSGDLLFFGDGEKVTHVGISIGGKDFIHQAGKVAINSLDPNSDVFSPYRSNSFMLIRRVITSNVN